MIHAGGFRQQSTCMCSTEEKLEHQRYMPAASDNNQPANIREPVTQHESMSSKIESSIKRPKEHFEELVTFTAATVTLHRHTATFILFVACIFILFYLFFYSLVYTFFYLLLLPFLSAHFSSVRLLDVVLCM